MTKIFIPILMAIATCSAFFPARAAANIEASGASLVTRVAPGEFLPISLKLMNFGERIRADVLVSYWIIDAEKNVIYQSTETVAVETSASFIKTVQIPYDTPSGRYAIKTTINYEGQEFPAETEFPFEVESKIAGVFKGDFILYAVIATAIALLVFLMGHYFISTYRKRRSTPLDYSNIAGEDRMFYELISDTIMSMRQRVGNDAVLIAEHIDGLKIDSKTGKVLSIDDKPSKIIASLVLEYEKIIGRKVSFTFRKGN